MSNQHNQYDETRISHQIHTQHEQAEIFDDKWLDGTSPQFRLSSKIIKHDYSNLAKVLFLSCNKWRFWRRLLPVAWLWTALSCPSLSAWPRVAKLKPYVRRLDVIEMSSINTSTEWEMVVLCVVITWVVRNGHKVVPMCYIKGNWMWTKEHSCGRN